VGVYIAGISTFARDPRDKAECDFMMEHHSKEHLNWECTYDKKRFDIASRKKKEYWSD
jgi:hypothetical protein